MDIVTKYDYCQACHLLLPACSCEKIQKAVTVQPAAPAEVIPVWLTTWKLKINGIEKTIPGVVAKGHTAAEIKAEKSYLTRALRGVKIPNGKPVIVLSVTLDKHL